MCFHHLYAVVKKFHNCFEKAARYIPVRILRLDGVLGFVRGRKQHLMHPGDEVGHCFEFVAREVLEGLLPFVFVTPNL